MRGATRCDELRGGGGHAGGGDTHPTRERGAIMPVAVRLGGGISTQSLAGCCNPGNGIAPPATLVAAGGGGGGCHAGCCSMQ